MFLLPLTAHALHAPTSASVSCILLRTVCSMCIKAPWQNRWAVHEQGRRMHISEQGSRLGAATQSGGKGTDICTLSFGHSLSPLSYSTSKLNLLHSNAVPAPPPQLRVIKRLQNIIIYIHKCHQNENYLDMNSFCCWCCLMSFKNVCIILSYTVFNLCNKAGWWIRIRGWRGNDHLRNHLVDALKW